MRQWYRDRVGVKLETTCILVSNQKVSTRVLVVSASQVRSSSLFFVVLGAVQGSDEEVSKIMGRAGGNRRPPQIDSASYQTLTNPNINMIT